MAQFTSLSFLIKPSSSMCNLRCSYCFYDDVSNHRTIKNHGFMNYETQIAIIQQAIGSTYDYAHITFAFQGGEPTLIGLEFYQQFIDEINKVKEHRQIHYAIQTNGTIIDDSWAAFFKKHQFLVGVSIDGFQENHDFFCYDAHQQGQYQQTLKGIEILRKWQVDVNILTVLTSRLSQYPHELYQFYKDHQFDYIQLIPCLPPLQETTTQDALKPKEFSSFYQQFFDLWIKDSQRFQVGLFSDVLSMFVGMQPQTCGMLGHCSLQLVIESDGSLYPCDFYCTDGYCLGNINKDPLETMISSSLSHRFLTEEKREFKGCPTCRFKGMCHGNCKRMNVIYFDEQHCGYQEFLEAIYDRGKRFADELLMKK